MAGEERGNVVQSGESTATQNEYHPFRINDRLYVPTISENHLRIHMEIAFKLCREIASILNANSYYILFQTPSDKLIHMRIWEFVADAGPAYFKFYENATITGTGSELISYNMKRTSANIAKMKIRQLQTMGRCSRNVLK